MYKAHAILLSFVLLSGLLSFNSSIAETKDKDLSYADFMIRSYYETPSDRYKILEIPLEQLNLDDPEVLFMLAEAHSTAYHFEKKAQKKEKAAQHREKLFDYYTKAANLGHATAWRRIGSHLYWENGNVKLHDEYQRKADDIEKPDCRSGDTCTAKTFKTLDRWLEHMTRLVSSDEAGRKHVELRQKEAWDALEAQGDIRDPKLLFYKGLFYEKGLGILKDLEKAKACYEKAFKEGFADAAYRLGLLFAKENRPKSHYYFEKACKMGSRAGCAARYGSKMVDRFDHCKKS